jgi:prefoldin subunit 5
MASTRARLTLVTLTVAVAAAAACYKDPNEQLDQMQQQLDLQATIDDLASRSTELQFALDSLRTVVAKQDTTIARLANLAGVPYR